MRQRSVLALAALCLGGALAAPAPSLAQKSVSGKLEIDGKTYALEHAYVDEADGEEPIVVLSDRSIPPETMPFLSANFVKEKKVHAIAFSLSRESKALTNTFGKVWAPEHEIGVGIGRVEDGNVKLTVTLISPTAIEGRIATVKPVKLSFVSYAFDLTFKAKAGGGKK
ncbi:MAG TPA: hypothetical protein VIW03_01200 [Anaeromyxobacter sp.]